MVDKHVKSYEYFAHVCRPGKPACPTGYNCVNTIGSFACECGSGFTKGAKGSCIDIDECKGGDSQCSDLSTCTNNVGSYDCSMQDLDLV
jgi:fibulin 1/2